MSTNKQSSNNFIDYNNVDEEKSTIYLQKNGDIYFLVYEYTNGINKDNIIIAKFSIKHHTDWKDSYIALATQLKSLIENYKLKFDIFKKRKIYDIKMNAILPYGSSDNSILNNLLFSKEGFELITNKFIFTDGLMERTVFFDNSKDDYDILIKDNQLELFKPIKEFYFNYYLTDDELSRLTLEQILNYVDYNKTRLENVIITSDKKYQNEYFSLDNWQAENYYLASFIDALMDFNKNKVYKKQINI